MLSIKRKSLSDVKSLSALPNNKKLKLTVNQEMEKFDVYQLSDSQLQTLNDMGYTKQPFPIKKRPSVSNDLQSSNRNFIATPAAMS